MSTEQLTTSRWQDGAAIDAVNGPAVSHTSSPLEANPIHDGTMEETDEYSG
jgi:hypothetical protein